MQRQLLEPLYDEVEDGHGHKERQRQPQQSGLQNDARERTGSQMSSESQQQQRLTEQTLRDGRRDAEVDPYTATVKASLEQEQESRDKEKDKLRQGLEKRQGTGEDEHGRSDNPNTTTSSSTSAIAFAPKSSGERALVTNLKAVVTTLSKEAKVGDSRLDVATSEGFKVGKRISIGAVSDPDRELNVVSGFGSLLLQTALKRSHPSGTKIEALDDDKESERERQNQLYLERMQRESKAEQMLELSRVREAVLERENKRYVNTTIFEY